MTLSDAHGPRLIFSVGAVVAITDNGVSAEGAEAER
jgi:hypothetical protein